MKIDLYQIHRRFHFTGVVYPIVLDAFKIWAEQAGWDATVTLCKPEKVNLDTDAQAVGICVYTQTAPLAYRLADRLRRLGKVVILGGPHFRGPATWKEAAHRCDVLVSSICKPQWQALLALIRQGVIAPGMPRAICVVDREGRFRYPDNFFAPEKSRKWYQVASVPTSLGCPFRCHFCSPYLQGSYLLREVPTIVGEVARIRDRVIFLADATFGLQRSFTFELMRALAPLNKLITIETALNRLRDPAVLDVLAAGGVKWIIVGVETLSERMNKHGSSDLRRTLPWLVRSVHDRGMYIQGNFICGLDADGPESFGAIGRLCERTAFDSVMVDVLTPYPNTRLYDRLQRQGRIIDRNWAHYDYRHIVYRPLNMTIPQLRDGLIGLYRELMSMKSIVAKAFGLFAADGVSRATSIVAANNAYFALDALRKIRALKKTTAKSPGCPEIASRAFEHHALR